MNEYPRLGFFDIDPDRFSAMMDELLKKGTIEMANYQDDEWIDVESFGEMIEDDYYDDSMDGDHESAFGSCGWGVDEQYNIDYDYGEDW